MDRDELLADLTLKMYTLERDKPPGWETEYNMHKASFEMAMATPAPAGPGLSATNIGLASGNRAMRAGGGLYDMAVGAVNFGNRALRGDWETDPDGNPVHDPATGMRIPRPDVMQQRGRNFAEQTFPQTSIDLLGDTDAGRRTGAMIDAGLDASIYTLGLSPVIAGGARAASMIPWVHKVTRPLGLEKLQMTRDATWAGVGGLGGGYFADEDGNSSFIAEVLTPLAIQGVHGGIRQIFRNRAPSASGGGAANAEETAANILATALDDEGMTIKQAVDIYREMGPEGLPVDISDAFRTIVREARSQRAASGHDLNVLKDRIEGDPMNPSTTGSTGRVNEAVGTELGNTSGRQYISNIQKMVDEDIDGLYASARGHGDQPLPDEINVILGDTKAGTDVGLVTVDGRPLRATDDAVMIEAPSNAMEQAKRDAREAQVLQTGQDIFTNQFDYIDAIKKSLDDQWKAANRKGNTNKARSILQMKNRLISAADEHFPGYREARDMFAGKATLVDAVNNGQDFLKLDIDEMQDLVASMSQSELDAFLIGARDSMLNEIGEAPIAGNSANRLVKNQNRLERLGIIFRATGGGDESLQRFLNGVTREGEFIRTRNYITGGSQTHDKQQAGEAMRSAIAGINRAQSYGELGQASVFAGLLQRMAAGKDSQQYKQSLVMLSDILLNSNIDAEAFRRTLERGNVRTLLRPAAWSIWGKANLPTYAENALRGGSYAEMAEMMTAERDRLEREYDEQDRTRRRETAAEARDLSPGTVAVGI